MKEISNVDKIRLGFFGKNWKNQGFVLTRGLYLEYNNTRT